MAAGLSRLIDEATLALTQLDGAALDRLCSKAKELAAMDLGGGGTRDRAAIAVLEARFRGFAALLEATGENLATLERAESQRAPLSPRPIGYVARGARLGDYGGTPRGLFESFGMYDESEVNSSIWPRGGVAQNGARAGSRGRRAASKNGQGTA